MTFRFEATVADTWVSSQITQVDDYVRVSPSLDTVLSEIRESIGDPAAFFLDLRPLHPPLAVICNHEVAEQITKSSKKFPYGLDKSPSLGPYKPLLGDNSIIVSAVGVLTSLELIASNVLNMSLGARSGSISVSATVQDSHPNT